MERAKSLPQRYSLLSQQSDRVDHDREKGVHMVRTVWALIQGTRRLYLVDDTCTFVEPVKRYLEALDIQGKSPNTLESYCRHLKHYFTFLEEAHLDWRAVAPDDLLRFVEWLRTPHRQLQVHPLHLTSRLSERSVNTILAAVASFYRYHVQRGQVLTNPVLTRRSLTASAASSPSSCIRAGGK
jgi:Phage integrase, N-terminal SAM-like domain